jgi:nucleoside-diphosphate-sugar epimerase
MRAAHGGSTHAVMQTILVTGGAGYIGSTLVPKLLDAGHGVIVADRFYFGPDSLSAARAKHGDRLRLVKTDIRRLDPAIFREVDAVVDLAGISNDPSCELDPNITRDVNLHGSVRTMKLARDAGVKRYVLSSSCSVYGRGEGLGLTESSGLHPVSPLCALQGRGRAGAARPQERPLLSRRPPARYRFRPFPRMRFDLAINVMTKNAYTRGQITVDGGGKQWRPFVHVADVAEAMMFFMTADAARVGGEVFNVGHQDNNVRILNLAYRVRDIVPGTQIVMAPTDPDLRDYNVRFDKLAAIWPGHAFRSIDAGIREILDALRGGRIDPDDRRWYTLEQYRFLVEVERTWRDVAIEGSVLS